MTPTWIKASLIIGIGIIYRFIGDRIKEKYVSKIFYTISLGCLILIIPVVLSKKYIIIAWGGEILFLSYLTWKYKNKDLEYGVLAIYLITFISNIFVRTEELYLNYIQDFMIISISFSIYLMLQKRTLPKYIRKALKGYKYFIYLCSIYFIGNIISCVLDNMDIETVERYSLTTLITILLVNIILRNVTYRVKEMQDELSLSFLATVEGVSILIINAMSFLVEDSYNQNISYMIKGLTIISNIYLYYYGRKDIYLAIFENREKDFKWVLGESIYLLGISYIMIENILNLKEANLLLNIIGLLICGSLVWKGFKVPNRSIRRTGLGIGIFFVLKSFIYDFLKFDSTTKIIAYFITGVLLIGTSYIYQSALKKLDKEERDE